MQEIKFTVYGTPTPKGRPKVVRKGKFSVAYTPKKTREGEQTFLQQAIKHKPAKPLSGPIKVTIRFFKLKPKSLPKRVVHNVKKPDVDNLIKLVLDTMNSIFFQDDSQIVELVSSKQYGQTPRTEVTLTAIEEEVDQKPKKV